MAQSQQKLLLGGQHTGRCFIFALRRLVRHLSPCERMLYCVREFTGRHETSWARLRERHAMLVGSHSGSPAASLRLQRLPCLLLRQRLANERPNSSTVGSKTHKRPRRLTKVRRAHALSLRVHIGLDVLHLLVGLLVLDSAQLHALSHGNQRSVHLIFLVETGVFSLL